MSKYTNLKNEILGDPAATHWLKRVLTELEARDPNDALGDLEALLRLQQLRLDEIVAKHLRGKHLS